MFRSKVFKLHVQCLIFTAVNNFCYIYASAQCRIDGVEEILEIFCHPKNKKNKIKMLLSKVQGALRVLERTVKKVKVKTQRV